MATGKRDEVNSANPEGPDAIKEEQLPKVAGQVTASVADGSTFNAGSSANPGSASSSTDEEPKGTGGRGSPHAIAPSDIARKDSCVPPKASVDEPKCPTSKTTRAKHRPSMGSVRKHSAPSDRRTSKISVSTKASNLVSGTSLHKAPSTTSVRTLVSASTSPIGSVALVSPPRHFNAATQNQLTPELCPASPVADAEALVVSEGTGTEKGVLKNQLCGRSSAGSELLLRSDSKEELEKTKGKEKAHAEVAKKVAEAPEKEEKPKKSPEVKKTRRKPPRGFKMPDGTYVGLSEKNRYLRAMYKEHLKCDYVPFCILGVLMVVVIALVYLYAFRPDIFNKFIEAIRNLLGLNKKDEEQDDPASIHNVASNSSLYQGAWYLPDDSLRPPTAAPTNESSWQMRIL